MSIAEKLTQVAENVPKVYEAGRNDERSEFWDDFQKNGELTNYEDAFSRQGWTEKTFRPKYDIIPQGSADRLFYQNYDIVDMLGCLKHNNVKIDLSKATSIRYLNQFGKIEAFGIIDTTSVAIMDSPLLGENYSVKTIEKVIFRDDGSQTVRDAFWGNGGLVNVEIQGALGNSFTLSFSNKLSVLSMKSFINALVNYAGTDNEFVYTITLHKQAWDRLDTEGATSPSGTTWKDYITEKGWNYA